MKLDHLSSALDGLEQRVGRLGDEIEPASPFGTYRDNPSGFVVEILRGKSATRRSTGEPYQFAWLESIRDHEQTAIRTGHGVGKSAGQSWAALWWMATRAEALVILLAPTSDRQGRGVLQREVARWARRGGITLRSDAVGLHLDVTGSRLVVLSGAADVGAIEGQHAASVLLLADEAKSLTRATLDAVSGALTGDEARTVLASTPGAPSGPFFEACNDERGMWARHYVGADDSSNVNPRWVASRKAAWGESSSTFRMRVAGEFPQDGIGTLFPWSLLHAAREPINRVPLSQLEARGGVMGVDCARSLGGDQSCVYVVRDGVVIGRDRWHSNDTEETVRRVTVLAVRHRPDVIRVDVGGPGGGVADRLRALGYEVEDIHFGNRSREAQRFANWRSEAYHHLRERIECGSLRLPDDDRLSEELAAIRVEWDRSGRLALAPKDEIRALLGRSPDDSDALALAVCGAPRGEWEPPPAEDVWIGNFRYRSGVWRTEGEEIAERLGLI